MVGGCPVRGGGPGAAPVLPVGLQRSSVDPGGGAEAPGAAVEGSVRALAAGSGGVDGFEEEEEFYRAKVQTSEFVFERLLPRTRAHRAAILAPTASLTSMRNDDFSFDHAR